MHFAECLRESMAQEFGAGHQKSQVQAKRHGLIVLFFFLTIDLKRRWLCDADGVRTGHRFL